MQAGWRYLTAALVLAGALAGAAQAAKEADTPAVPDAAPESRAGGPTVPLPSKALRDKLLDTRSLEDFDPGDYGSVSGRGQYQMCLDRVATKPDEAFDIGSAWRDQGGGAPALHCIALALVELGHTGEAALRLEDLARAPGAGSVEIRVDILSQAGNAWLLEGQARRAISAFTAGIDLALTDEEVTAGTLYFDRARAHGLIGEWQEAHDDLTRVLGDYPKYLSALVLRATALRQLGKPRAARQDIDTALRMSPDDPAALIERGILRAQEGAVDAARRDWAQAAVVGKGTDLQEVAQNLIIRLDLEGQVPDAVASQEEPASPPELAPSLRPAIRSGGN